MRKIGIRDLKARLSEYLRSVADGDEILVTDRGRVVARIAPANEQDLEVYRGLDDLAKRGVIRRAVRENGPDLYPKSNIKVPRGTASQLLDETRGDR